MSVVITHCCDQFSIITTEDMMYSAAYLSHGRKLYWTPFGYCSGVGFHDDILRVVKTIQDSDESFEALQERLEKLKLFYEINTPWYNSYIVLSVCVLSRERCYHKIMQINVHNFKPYLSSIWIGEDKSEFFVPEDFLCLPSNQQLITKWKDESKLEPKNLPLIMYQMALAIAHISKECPTKVSTLCYYGIDFLGSKLVYKIEAQKLCDIYKESDYDSFLNNLLSYRIINELKNLSDNIC